MPTPPKAIDPALLLAYLSSNHPQDTQFLQIFNSFHPTISTANSNEHPLRLYIVQQPAPAKHRRSYVEIKDLRALCGHDPATDLAASVSDAPGGGEGAAMSDLKDSVLVMRRILEAPVLTAETLACLPGSDGSTAGSGSDSTRGDGSSNAGDDTSSSLADDDMTGGNGVSGGEMELSKMFLGMSMGISDHSDGSDSTLPPPSSTNTPAQSLPEQVDYQSDGAAGDIYDDEDEDGTNDDTREGKRARHSTTAINPHQALPPFFRPLIKDGKVQFEIWVVAFLKPQLLADLPPKPCPGGGPHMQSSSQWTERVNELLDSTELQRFVTSEVAGGRIGVDFKKIMAEKKDGRKSTRTVIR
ncbi:hypothetical protein EC957_004728 [Mortierella hygrophila]|uniref:Uncharacterized protein n=1 Tax=Mortierella hygrophila TaxID=979708 RepID=A0A9P6FFQ7_9FUNG|nr:hypothetical protein EC957_004728 [Mortierella hygrophila]